MSTDADHNDQPEGSVPSSIEFHYTKSPYFRVVQADGVWGGVTPRGVIHMAFFNERHPLPERTTYDITPEGRTGPERLQDRVQQSGAERHFEVDVILNLNVAISFRNWLNAKIEELQQALREEESAGGEEDEL